MEATNNVSWLQWLGIGPDEPASIAVRPSSNLYRYVRADLRSVPSLSRGIKASVLGLNAALCFLLASLDSMRLSQAGKRRLEESATQHGETASAQIKAMRKDGEWSNWVTQKGQMGTTLLGAGAPFLAGHLVDAITSGPALGVARRLPWFSNQVHSALAGANRTGWTEMVKSAANQGSQGLGQIIQTSQYGQQMVGRAHEFESGRRQQEQQRAEDAKQGASGEVHGIKENWGKVTDSLSALMRQIWGR